MYYVRIGQVSREFDNGIVGVTPRIKQGSGELDYGLEGVTHLID